MREGCHTACVLGCSLLQSGAGGGGFAGLRGEDSCLVQARSFGSRALSLSLCLSTSISAACLLTWLLLLSDLISVYKSESFL